MHNYIKQIESLGFYHSRTDGQTIGITHDNNDDLELIVEFNEDFNVYTIYSLYYGEDEEIHIDEEYETIEDLLEALEDISEEL